MSYWTADGLLGPNGRFYRFSPDASIGSQVPCDAERAQSHEAVDILKERDGTYTIVAVQMSLRHNRTVVVSSPDAVGSVQTRYYDERYADETFTFVEPMPTGSWNPPYLVWSVHTRENEDGETLTFAPTVFTVVNPQKVQE